MPEITVIPATRAMHTRAGQVQKKRRKVAGYARVSTDSEEQATSYEAQIDYYSNYIQANPDWEFVSVYTDEGISATSTRHREGFQQMVADALAGKIDLIVTKSVSRFARNTVDSLTTIRKLKDAGCECYFEKENIWTFDSKGELLITIMSSLAQEESRSISENITWGQRKRFADGKVSLPYKHFLGYRKGSDGLPEIVPEEAEIVRMIYRMFIDGKTVSYIAKHLTAQHIPTPAGKEIWQTRTVESILTNEKYKGDARLQKTFTVDFLSKRIKANEGEVPQYYVTGSHPAIIAPAEWDAVQLEMQRRKDSGRRQLCASCFSGKIFCGDCGAIFGSKVWHSNDSYRRIIWQCNAKFQSEHKCQTPHLTEQQIKDAYCAALSRLLQDRDALIDDIRILKHQLTDCSDLDADISAVEMAITETAALVRRCVEANTQSAQDQHDYSARYGELLSRYEQLQKKQSALRKDREDRMRKADYLSGFLFEIGELDDLNIQFSPQRWNATVDHVTVNTDGSLEFIFKNGGEITVNLTPRGRWH